MTKKKKEIKRLSVFQEIHPAKIQQQNKIK